MARRAVLAVVVAMTLSVAGLAGCGGGGGGSASNPNDVKAALQSTAVRQGLKLTLTLTGSPDNSSGNGSSPTRAQQQAILDSTLVLTVHAASGSNLANAGNGGELDLAIQHGLSTLAELRVVSKTLYLRVDIPQFTSTYHLDQGAVARFQSQLSQLGSQVGGLSALNQGKWVSVDINLLNQFAQTAGVTLPSSPQLVGRIVGAFFNSLARTPTQNIGAVHGGQTQITVGARPLVTAVTQAISSTPGMSSFGAQINSLSQQAGNAVPANATGKLNVTISGGKVTNMELPIKQFQKNPPAGGPESFKMAVADSGAVSAPSGATTLNLAQLFHAMAGSG